MTVLEGTVAATVGLLTGEKAHVAYALTCRYKRASIPKGDSDVTTKPRRRTVVVPKQQDKVRPTAALAVVFTEEPLTKVDQKRKPGEVHYDGVSIAEASQTHCEALGSGT